jgi:two-component system, sensor histidine kinase PdtaS
MASKDPKIQFAFEQASSLVHIVARLNSRLNAAGNDSEVDTGIFIPEICEDLQACAQTGVTIECDAENHDLPLTLAVPLGLIINELVTNALKYAFPNKRTGSIVVTFARAQNRYQLIVEDNGAGMSKDVQGSGLGLHLLDGFSKAIHGTVDICSTPEGTTVALKFEAPFEREIELLASEATIH